MGFIMLVGMVVNNAIVLIDYTGKLRSEGSGCGSIANFRSVRNSVYSYDNPYHHYGAVPNMSSGSGTETRDLSIVAIGLTLSTVVTLVFIPVYITFDNFRNKKAKNKQKQVSDIIEIKY